MRGKQLLIQLVIVTTLMSPTLGWSQEEREDGWISRSTPGAKVQTRELKLHTKLEPKPALKYRLIPDEYDRVDGNAALFYLKAIGFLEENYARDLISKFKSEAEAEATARGEDDYAPYNWMKTHPDDLPRDEVKRFLRLVDFQVQLVRDGSLRKQFSMDRNIRQEKNPIAYLLPEINAMRELARYQSLRCRLALAEGRVDDAIETIGQTNALAAHLGQDEFLVSQLVGIAIASIAWDDTFYLMEHADSPNLYWAFATLPRPFINSREAMAYEHQILFEQIKLLKRVDEQIRPIGYWQDFVDQLVIDSESIVEALGVRFNLGEEDRDGMKLAIVSAIAASYPAAKEYLIEDVGIEREKVESYPKVQTVMLALKRYSESVRDNQVKWHFLPYALAQQSGLRSESQQQNARDAKRLGWITTLAQALLPGTEAIRTAMARNEQRFALTQTIEAIRFSAARNDGELPNDIDNLPLPAMLDPITGRSFEYRRDGNKAVLKGAVAAGHQYRFVIEIAP